MNLKDDNSNNNTFNVIVLPNQMLSYIIYTSNYEFDIVFKIYEIET